MTRRTIPALLAFVVLLSSSSFARTNLVPIHYGTIQEAIDATHDGDTVIVAPGVYNENLRFIGRHIVVGSYSLTVGGDVWIGETIIDGQGRAAVASFFNSIEQSTLRGFTLRNGFAEHGGGIFCANGRPTLEDLLVTQNHVSDVGGGIAVLEGTPIMNRIEVIENSADLHGGGIYFFNSSPVLSNCRIVGNSSVRGSGMFSTGSDFNIQRVLIADNISEDDGAVEILGGNQNGDESYFDHITVANNQCGNGHTAGLVLNTDTAEDIPLTITNSILWDNNGRQISIRDGGNEWDGFSTLTIRYCDIEDGRDSIRIGERGEVDWGAGNIDEAPGLAAPDEGDYRLSNDSPCKNTGDPEFERDPDDSRTDMGALGLWEPSITLAGIVLDSETDEPIPFAGGMGLAENGFILLIRCDSSGVWLSEDNPRIDELNIKIAAVDYLTAEYSVEIPDADSFWIETRLDHAEFVAASDTLSAVLDSGEFIQQIIAIRNDGNGDLTWKSEVRNHGDSGLPPMSLRQQINATNITGDETLLAAVFDGENYFVAGANGFAPNMIWIIDRDGAVIDHFQQPGGSRLGFRDLEWDGELIWGADEDTIYAFDREGNVQTRWRGPDQFNSNIAIDSTSHEIWLSGTTTNIVAYDRIGNALGRSINRSGMRMNGLSWLTDAPDGANLIVLHELEDGASGITGVNPITGDTTGIGVIQNGINRGLSGLSTTQIYDRYAGSVMLIMQNYSMDEWGDKLNIYQLQPNRQWAMTEPGAGVVAPGESQEIEVLFNTAMEDYGWGLRGGTYSGDLIFSHDGRGGEFSVPVELEVIPPANVESGNGLFPNNPQITALYPMPFNSSLTLEYFLPRAGDAIIRLTDLNGRNVAKLIENRLSSGNHAKTFSAENLSSGIYLLNLQGETGTSTRKIVLMK